MIPLNLPLYFLLSVVELHLFFSEELLVSSVNCSDL